VFAGASGPCFLKNTKANLTDYLNSADGKTMLSAQSGGQGRPQGGQTGFVTQLQINQVPKNPKIDYKQAMEDAEEFGSGGSDKSSSGSSSSDSNTQSLGTGPASINVQAWLEAKQAYEMERADKEKQEVQLQAVGGSGNNDVDGVENSGTGSIEEEAEAKGTVEAKDDKEEKPKEKAPNVVKYSQGFYYGVPPSPEGGVKFIEWNYVLWLRREVCAQMILRSERVT
jgi:hypothetical protein